MSILEELMQIRKADAMEAAKCIAVSTLEERISQMPATLDFAATFRRNGVRMIAELKKASPSKGLIRDPFDPVSLAVELESAGAAALSVLIEPHRFLGSVDFLRMVRPSVSIPLLYKDFVSMEYQILEARASGADAVLLIVRALSLKRLEELLGFARSLGLRVLVETHCVDEIHAALDVGAEIIGVNSRDLRTFSTDPCEAFRLLSEIPQTKIAIAESGILNVTTLQMARAAGASGFLIGESLMRAERPGERLKEFLSCN